MRRRHLSLDPRRHVAGDARHLLGATKKRREGTLHPAGDRRRRRRLLELDELKRRALRTAGGERLERQPYPTEDPLERLRGDVDDAHRALGSLHVRRDSLHPADGVDVLEQLPDLRRRRRKGVGRRRRDEAAGVAGERPAVTWTPRTARHKLTAMRAACTATVFEKIWRKVRETWRSSASRICRSRSYDLIRQSSRPSSSSARVTST